MNSHSPFDLALGCPVDNLHAIYLGVALKLLKFWFTNTYKSKEFSQYNQVYSVMDRVCMILTAFSTRPTIHKSYGRLASVTLGF